MTPDELRALVPTHKTDTAGAERIVALGYPTVKPILRDILDWIDEPNDLVAWVFVPFVLGLGESALPEVRAVLEEDVPPHDPTAPIAGDDKRAGLLSMLVSDYPVEIVRQLVPTLERLAFMARAASSGRPSETSTHAFVILAKYRLGDEARLRAAATVHCGALSGSPFEVLESVRSWPRTWLADLTRDISYWSRYHPQFNTALLALGILIEHQLADAEFIRGSIDYLKRAAEHRRALAERELSDLEVLIRSQGNQV